jgi:hypothetical protein
MMSGQLLTLSRVSFLSIISVRNRTLTLIEREDDTRSWGNFLLYFSHNAMPT